LKKTIIKVLLNLCLASLLFYGCTFLTNTEGESGEGELTSLGNQSRSTGGENMTFSHPGGLYTDTQFGIIKAKVRVGEEPWAGAYSLLISQADSWLSEVPSAVETWDCPGAYVDHDGHIYARSLMLDDAKAAYACAMAFEFTGSASYADKAVEILDDWSYTNIAITGSDGPLVSAYVATGFILTAEILSDYIAWTSEDRGQFESWITDVLLPEWDYIMGTMSNNWMDWAIFAKLVAHHYLEDGDSFYSTAESLKQKIDESIASEGYLIHEISRGANSMWYHYFSLAPMSASCQIVFNETGEDLFNWTSDSGKSLRSALEYFLYYSRNPDQWPWYTGPNFPADPTGSSWPFNLYEAMGGIYGDGDYSDFASDLRPLYGPFNSGLFHHIAWFYPTLMYQALQIESPDYPAYPGWDLIYDELDDYTEQWDTTEASGGTTGYITQNSGYITLVENGADEGTPNYFFMTKRDFSPPEEAFTFELRAKTTEESSNNMICVRSGVYEIILSILYGTAGTVQNRETDPSESLTLDTTVGHVYRVVVHSDFTYDLYVDGELAWSDSPNSGSGSAIFKIGGSASPGITANLDLAYVRMGTGEILP